MKNLTNQPLARNLEVNVKAGAPSCCSHTNNESDCCVPSKTSQENNGACCPQPSDGSACCRK